MKDSFPSHASFIPRSEAHGVERKNAARSPRPIGTLPGILSAAAILFCIALIPVMSVRIPPLVDYPNHMARMHILADGGHNPFLREYYEIHWDILPNLAMDLVIPPLTGIMSLESAGKTFIALTFALLIGGVFALYAALHRTLSAWPLLAFFFLYNSVFLWGFLNFLFGLGLALLTSALWIVLRTRSAALTIPLFTALGIMLFFAHLFALGVFGLIFTGYELGQLVNRRQHVGPFHGLPFWKGLPAILLPLFLLTLSPTFKSEAEHLPSWLRGSPPRPTVTFAPLNVKMEALKGTLRTQDLLLDRITGLSLCVLIGAGIVRRQLRVPYTMVPPLTLAVLAALAMPSTIGTTGFVDIRMPVVCIFLAIASSQWRRMSRRWFLPVTLGLGLLFVFRIIHITDHWLETDRHYTPFIEALDRLPEGTRLLSAIKAESFDATSAAAASIVGPLPMSSLSCWAIIRRSAFVSGLFSARGQQPVTLSPPFRSFVTIGEFLVQGVPISWERIQTQYDYVAARPSQRLRPPIPEKFTPFVSGEDFQFYRIGGRGP